MESNAINKRRKWWLAGVLSLIMPGLGQLYNGEVCKAAILYFVPLALVLPGAFLIARVFSKSVLFASFALIFTCYFYVIIDAAWKAKKLGDSYKMRKYNRWYIYLLVLLCASALSSAAESFVKGSILRAFRFPSGSMEPTLLVGDYILADMTPAGRKPTRGELVVFVYPEDPAKDFLKRVVAVGGDKVELRDKTLFVNDVSQQEPYVIHTDKTMMAAKNNPRDNFCPIIVPSDSYFVMGDNRDKSYDSRFWGAVQNTKIHGKVIGIYWSWNSKRQTPRWHRIGMRINEHKQTPTNR